MAAVAARSKSRRLISRKGAKLAKEEKAENHFLQEKILVLLGELGAFARDIFMTPAQTDGIK